MAPATKFLTALTVALSSSIVVAAPQKGCIKGPKLEHWPAEAAKPSTP